MKKYNYNQLLFSFLCLFCTSCSKFLDASPDKQLTTPNTIQDLRAILDFNGLMNADYSSYGAIASDNYYTPDVVYYSLNDIASKNDYAWGLIEESTDQHHNDWLQNYKRIFNVNVVLNKIDKIGLQGASISEREIIKGEALFYRALTLFNLSQVYALPYNPSSAKTTPGIPLKLTADINEVITRPDLQSVYQQIISDLDEASSLLPVSNFNLLRPNKLAALGLLANVYLVMQQFDKALFCANSYLNFRSELIDYNTISQNSGNPFVLFNKEVAWHADLAYNQLVATSRCKVDSIFFRSFDENDLRKYIYFQNSNPVVFKGYYNGQWQGTTRYFCGIATDEIYLIKAECQARKGEIRDAMVVLDLLLQNRYKKNGYIPFTATTEIEALNIILEHRRKELCFRGALRWMDIRRLNQYPYSESTLTRKVNGVLYKLKPGDLHFAFLIPQNVIDNSGIEQNKR